MVWYSQLFKNFPQFLMIYRVKGFSIVNEAEVDVFLKFSSFFYDPMIIGNLIIPGPPALGMWSLSYWITGEISPT